MNKSCPYCNALNSTTAGFCARCGQLFLPASAVNPRVAMFTNQSQLNSIGKAVIGIVCVIALMSLVAIVVTSVRTRKERQEYASWIRDANGVWAFYDFNVDPLTELASSASLLIYVVDGGGSVVEIHRASCTFSPKYVAEFDMVWNGPNTLMYAQVESFNLQLSGDRLVPVQTTPITPPDIWLQITDKGLLANGRTLTKLEGMPNEFMDVIAAETRRIEMTD